MGARKGGPPRDNADAGRSAAPMAVTGGRFTSAGLHLAAALLICSATLVPQQQLVVQGQFVGIDFNSPARLVFTATQLAEALLDQSVSRVVIHGAPQR